jgi:hypothetical protein
MSPGPGPRRRAYGTISPLLTLDDTLLMSYTPATSTAPSTRQTDVRHVGQLNFDEDYDEWSLYAAPTNNTNSDLGQLLSPIVMGAAAAVSEGVTTLPLTRPKLHPAAAVVVTSTSSVVHPLSDYHHHHPPQGEEFYVDEMEEDWRILHEARRNLVILEGGGDYDSDDVSLEY